MVQHLRPLSASAPGAGPAAPTLERIARLAAQMLRAPAGLVTVTDDHGVYCHAHFGLDAHAVANAESFLGQAAESDGVSVVLDAARDPRFAGSPLVAGPMRVRFYAGARVATPDGRPAGAVCVFDTDLRPALSAQEQDALADIAALAAEVCGAQRGADAAALHARTAELTEVNRRAKLGMWHFPQDGGAVCWSNEIFEIFGRRPPIPPVLADVLAWVHPDDRDAVRAAFRTAKATRIKQAFEFRVVRPDGRTRHCQADLYPELGRDGDFVALKGFCQDVTERRETELALLHSEKLRAIGQLTGGVAHDFNNLLTIIVLSLEEAIETLPPQDPLQEALQPALHASMRGQELTAQLLSYARSARLEPARIDLDAFFAQLLPLLRRTLGDRYGVALRQAPDAGQPFGDPAKLESAVMNMVINARDAMPQGGTIRIETGMVTLSARDAGFTDPVTPGRYTVIRVSDPGTGIPPDVLPRIFDPFFTTKPVGKGSGLGLSVMYGFVKQSGGHVTASSRVGAGTTISVYLPMAEAGGVKPTAAEPADTL